jgi:hypothetical protein
MDKSNAPKSQDNTPNHTNDSQNSGTIRNAPPRVGSHPPPPPEHNNPHGDPGQPPWWRQLPVWTFIGEIVLIAITIRIACIYSGQLNQMIESNKITRNALQVSQGASISLGRKDGTVAEFILPKDVKDNAGIVIYFQNSGHIPARFGWGLLTDIAVIPPSPDFSTVKSPHHFSQMTRTRSRKDGSISTGGGSVTIPGDSTYVTDVAELPAIRVRQLSHSNQLFMVWGRLEYCDSLGTYESKDFQIFYQGIPYNAFRLASETDTAEFLTETNRSDPNLEYLFPCETKK